MIQTFTVIFDACVFFSAARRGLVMRLATTGLFRARWSASVHAEWIAAVARRYPDIAVQDLRRLSAHMDAHVEGSIVTGFEDLIPGLQLPDPKDRHVLAAAIRAGAAVIVTLNLKHFPARSLEQYGMQAQHPDKFIVHLLDLAPRAVCDAIREDRLSLTRPAHTAEEYVRRLDARADLPRTAAALRPYLHLL